DRQVSRPMEEILGEINSRTRDVPTLGYRSGFCQIKRSHAEERPGALAVAASDDRRVDVKEILLLKGIVDRSANTISHAGNRTESVGARTKVSDRPEKLEGMSLFLKWIFFGIG